MSYLSPLRFHFAGDFFSSPSTVNNLSSNVAGADVSDPAKVKEFRDRAWTVTDRDHPTATGLWNPGGTHAFRFVDTGDGRVTVRSAVGSDGGPVAGDPVLGMRLVTRSAPRDAKLVDLDVDQPMASMIFGLVLTLRDAAGVVLLEAAMDPVPFTDIWGRVPGNQTDLTQSAAYQSTLTVSRWGDLSTSPFLTQLRATVGDGLLSVKFTVDGYSWTPELPDGSPDPRFRLGRVVGTVGGAASGEPKHTVVGRQFGTGDPAAQLNFFPGVLDAAAGRIRLDLGNALPTDTPGGPIRDIGELTLAYRADGGTVTPFAPPVTIDYRGDHWYERTAGVVDLPADRTLTADELTAVKGHALLVLGPDQSVQSEETPVHVRADAFVARLDAEAEWEVHLHVTDHGEPVNHPVNLRLVDPPALADALPHLRAGLTVPKSATFEDPGHAKATIKAHDPGNPRFFRDRTVREHVDGQFYRVIYNVDGVAPANRANVLSVLVWNAFGLDPAHPPTWNTGIGEIFRAYGNLYPYMTNEQSVDLDLTVYDQVTSRASEISDRLGLADTDPRYMPVTRDLSGQRKRAIQFWLQNPGPDGLPLLNPTGVDDVGQVAEPAVAAAATVPDVVDPEEVELGSKTAFARRLARAEGTDPP